MSFRAQQEPGTSQFADNSYGGFSPRSKDTSLRFPGLGGDRRYSGRWRGSSSVLGSLSLSPRGFQGRPALPAGEPFMCRQPFAATEDTTNNQTEVWINALAVGFSAAADEFTVTLCKTAEVLINYWATYTNIGRICTKGGAAKISHVHEGVSRSELYPYGGPRIAQRQCVGDSVDIPTLALQGSPQGEHTWLMQQQVATLDC
ncbi:hypothetical protein B0H17DRAFT_1142321 [Mycena rosella]|uniref:Uncharacterized protein n=1 Tax=Mycena rosella TaxID=1033263 RepID=A0AAD7CY31_MYCRO|nr:hypothetical protein B0H17DRAFT_1142321 [Mycena rosella]